MSLQERFFNLEKQGNQKDAVIINLKSSISDLENTKEIQTSRISELCAEIKTLRESLGVAAALAEQQTQESSGKVSMLQIKIHELQTQVDTDSHTIDSMNEDRVRRDRGQAAGEVVAAEVQTKIEKLRAENAQFKNRAVHSEEMASQLQDYKKRAQLALKQVLFRLVYITTFSKFLFFMLCSFILFLYCYILLIGQCCSGGE